MGFEPFGLNVIIKRRKARDATASGIIIPEQAKERVNDGIVISVGPGEINKAGIFQKPVVQPGDHVVFGTYAGKSFELDGEEYDVVHESEIYGRFTKEESDEQGVNPS